MIRLETLTLYVQCSRISVKQLVLPFHSLVRNFGSLLAYTTIFIKFVHGMKNSFCLINEVFTLGEKFANPTTCEVSILMVYLELTLHKRLWKLKMARIYKVDFTDFYWKIMKKIGTEYTVSAKTYFIYLGQSWITNTNY